MKKQLEKFLLVCLLVLPPPLFAQSEQIKGTVKDAELNKGMPGVTVLVQGSQKGTITDQAGKYSIKAKQGQTLVFSYIGYKPVEVKIGAQTTINVSLVEDMEEMESVVVIGYGVQKKASSVGSISSAKGDDLMKTGGVTSVSEALQGQMPGVVAINSNSKPGANAADLFIRGKGTWGNSSPLVLVDGIERNFNDVDINEIESISVLKDASATAVYGVKGANGVILLTSKRGKAQQAQVSFSANLGFKRPSSKMETGDYITAMELYNEANANDMQWDKIIPESTIEAWRNAYATGNYGPYNDYFPQIDWWKETVKKAALQQNYNINVRGGTEKMRYFTSVGYLADGDVYKTSKQPDFDPSFDYKRFNWRFNMDYDLTKSTLFSANIAGKVGIRNQPVYQADDDSDKYFFNPFLTSPTNTFPIQYSDGHWGETTSGRENLIANMLTGGQVRHKSFEGFYDFAITQDLDFITEGLSLKGTVSYTSSSGSYSQIINHGALGASSTTGPKNEIRYSREYDYANPIVGADGSITYPLLSEVRFPNTTTTEGIPSSATYDTFSNYDRQLYYEFALNYKASFSGHNITALALFLRRMEESSADKSKMNFASYEEDWVGRVTYNWKERYLMEVNAAYTGSEKFAPGKRFGFFPSFSAGWRISEEPWMKWKPLSNLKLRYSYGKVGNDRSAKRFNYIQIYSSGGNATFGLNQNVNFGPLYTEGSVADPNATWEESTKQNLGLELGLFQKLNLTLDLFDEHRTKILMTRNTMASWFGASLPSLNLGETKNHGFELDVEWKDRIGKNFNYWARFNVASSENRVVFRDDPWRSPDYLKLAGKPIGVQSKLLAPGNYTSLDDIFNGPITNISNASQGMLVPGDLYYIDYNGDGVINLDTDRVPMRYLNYPLTTYGLTLGFTYKNFSFNALLYAAPEVYKDEIGTLLWDFPGSNIKAQPNALSRWTPDKSDARGAIRPSVHLSSPHNSAPSTFAYTDHSYLRLKNVEVSYSLPKNLIRKIFMSNCQVYVNANNLFTFSKADKRRDPETQNSAVYPIIKRYNIGLRLTF